MTAHNSMVEFKYKQLRGILEKMGSVVIAFSGGVDSTLLLRAAGDTLKDRVLAVTARSETTPRHEMADAIQLGKDFGVNHLVIDSQELDLPEFVKNPEDKCYICKKERFGTIVQLAQERGISYVVDGSNVDDKGDYRPGMRAILELGVRSPLAEAGLSKAEIRSISKKMGLFTWNKPSYACLASRIPYGSPITAKKLRQVDACEEYIRSTGLSGQVRVRHYGDTARIEIARDNIPMLIEASIRDRIVEYFKELGFRFVTLDLEGYSMGSLNRAIGH